MIAFDEMLPEFQRAYLNNELALVNEKELRKALGKIKEMLTPEQFLELSGCYQFNFQPVDSDQLPSHAKPLPLSGP